MSLHIPRAGSLIKTSRLALATADGALDSISAYDFTGFVSIVVMVICNTANCSGTIQIELETAPDTTLNAALGSALSFSLTTGTSKSFVVTHGGIFVRPRLTGLTTTGGNVDIYMIGSRGIL